MKEHLAFIDVQPAQQNKLDKESRERSKTLKKIGHFIKLLLNIIPIKILYKGKRHLLFISF